MEEEQRIADIIRIVLADDHPVTRAGVRKVLESAPYIQIVGEAQDGAEAQQLTAELRPHVLLLDLRMPGPRPSEVEAWVRAHCPETITLVLTAHDVDAYLAEMMEAGAAGFVTKNEAPKRLVQAIRRAARGETLFDGEQLARASRWREQVGRRWESLSEREREVLRLLEAGSDNAAIARSLCIQVRTVEHHVTSILSKLGVASRLEAVAWVHRHLPDDVWNSTG
jgi:DNA-binding NarL/FixJ family response regulator